MLEDRRTGEKIRFPEGRDSVSMRVPLFALGLTLVLVACGPEGEAPTLESLRCARDHDCQSSADPFSLDLAVDFTDADGDLGLGFYTVYIDGSSSSGPLPLESYFQSAGLEASATEGALVLPAGLHLTGLHSGMTFVVGLEVTDLAGNRSNRPGIRFRLDLH